MTLLKQNTPNENTMINASLTGVSFLENGVTVAQLLFMNGQKVAEVHLAEGGSPVTASKVFNGFANAAGQTITWIVEPLCEAWKDYDFDDPDNILKRVTTRYKEELASFYSDQFIGDETGHALEWIVSQKLHEEASWLARLEFHLPVIDGRIKPELNIVCVTEEGVIEKETLTITANLDKLIAQLNKVKKAWGMDDSCHEVSRHVFEALVELQTVSIHDPDIDWNKSTHWVCTFHDSEEDWFVVRGHQKIASMNEEELLEALSDKVTFEGGTRFFVSPAIPRTTEVDFEI